MFPARAIINTVFVSKDLLAQGVVDFQWDLSTFTEVYTPSEPPVFRNYTTSIYDS